eukprot:9493170-Pyramimonas_sp.AAC.1
MILSTTAKPKSWGHMRPRDQRPGLCRARRLFDLASQTLRHPRRSVAGSAVTTRETNLQHANSGDRAESRARDAAMDAAAGADMDAAAGAATDAAAGAAADAAGSDAGHSYEYDPGRSYPRYVNGTLV